jgi:hypothetical protein
MSFAVSLKSIPFLLILSLGVLFFLIVKDIVALLKKESQAPVARTFGSSVEDYREGRFILYNGEKVFMYTNIHNVVYIKTEERTYMFGPDDIAGFAEYINENIYEMWPRCVCD